MHRYRLYYSTILTYFEIKHAQHMALVGVVDSENTQSIVLVGRPKRFEANIRQFFVTLDRVVP